MAGQSKKAFALNQQLQVGEAIKNTYGAAIGAYNAMAGIPIVGPALGVAAAAAAVAFGAKQVQAIKSQKFGGGGSASFGGGGSTPTPTGRARRRVARHRCPAIRVARPVVGSSRIDFAQCEMSAIASFMRQVMDGMDKELQDNGGRIGGYRLQTA